MAVADQVSNSGRCALQVWKPTGLIPKTSTRAKGAADGLACLSYELLAAEHPFQALLGQSLPSRNAASTVYPADGAHFSLKPGIPLAS